MIRTRTAIGVAAGLALLLPAGATAGPFGWLGGPSETRAKAKLVSCIQSEDPAERLAVFRGEMIRVRGATVMEMRFTVSMRRQGEFRFRTVSTPALQTWNRSHRRVTYYNFNQQVTNLDAPAEYRAVIDFRWRRGARTVRRSTGRTPICAMVDQRPQLTILRSAVEPTSQPGVLRYRLLIGNLGGGPASAFDTTLFVDGVAEPPVTVPALSAGARTEVQFTAPACVAGGSVRAVLDLDGKVTESREDDNELTRMCQTSAPPP